MVLLQSARNTPRNRRQSGRTTQLIAALSLKGSFKRCELEDFFKQKGLHRHLKNRLWRVLHYYVIPNLADDELRLVLEEITAPQYFPSQLWAWIGSWEEPCARLMRCVDEKNLSLLGDLLHRSPQHAWCFIDQAQYFNIAHCAVESDLLEITIFLCRSTSVRARTGLNQTNFYDETPAHMAARQVKATHLRQLVNCDWVDLLLTDPLGRTSIHTLLCGVLRPSSRTGKSMTEIISVVSDAFARCHRLAGVRDRSGWTVADYALSLRSVNMLTISIQPVVASDSIFNSETGIAGFIVSLLKHAILKNDPTLISCIYPHFLKFVLRDNGSRAFNPKKQKQTADINGPSNYSLIDIIEFAVDTKSHRALHLICSNAATVLALRQLGVLGWTPVPRAVISVGKPFSTDSTILKCLLGYFSGEQAWIHHEDDSMHRYQQFDNSFSIASFLGNVDTLRALLIAAGAAKVIPRKRINCSDPLCYYFNRHVYRSNPIVAAIIGRNSNVTAGQRNIFGGYHELKVKYLEMVQYLLVQTPFAGIKNTPQELESGDSNMKRLFTSPLAQACQQIDLEVVQLLCDHGCDPLCEIPNSSAEFIPEMNRVRAHLQDIIQIEAAIDSQGLSNWAISRAHDFAKEEMEKLSILETRSRLALEELNSDELESIANDYSRGVLPNSYRKVLVLIARICNMSGMSNLSCSKKTDGELDKTVGDFVLSRPATLVREAIHTMRVMEVPHLYRHNEKEISSTTATLIERIRKDNSDADLETSCRLEKEKRRLLSTECQEHIRQCVELINSQLSGILRLNHHSRSRKRTGPQAVISAFCSWVMSINEASDVVSSNGETNYVSTAGVLRLQFLRLKNDVATTLNKSMSRPLQLNSLHLLTSNGVPTGRRKVLSTSSIFEVLLSAIEQKYENGTPTTLSDPFSKSKDSSHFIDIRSKSFLLCLQYCGKSVVSSYIWDTAVNNDHKLMSAVLQANRKQLATFMSLRYNSLFMLEDASGVEKVLYYRFENVRNLVENYRVLGCVMSANFLLGRSRSLQLLEAAITRLDVNSVVLVLVGGIFDHSDKANVAIWNRMIDMIPKYFANLEFQDVLDNNSCAMKRNASAMFAGNGGGTVPTYNYSLETKCFLLREMLVSYRDAHYAIEPNENTTLVRPVTCAGSLCCTFNDSASSTDLFSSEKWPSMDSFELSKNYTVNYCLDPTGASALGGLIMLVRRDSDKIQPPKTSFFSSQDISRFLSVGGEWIDIENRAGGMIDMHRGERNNRKHRKFCGTWCSNYESYADFQRPISLISTADRFLLMPSSVINAKSVALVANVRWVGNVLQKCSPQCNMALNRAIKVTNGGGDSVGLANTLVHSAKSKAISTPDESMFSEILMHRASCMSSKPDGSEDYLTWVDDSMYCGLYHAAASGNLEVVRALLQCDSDTPPAKKTAVGESSLVVWKFSCVERLDSCYAEVNIKIFLDELHSEAARRLVSSKRRYNALISTAEGLAPSSSCRSFLDLLMSMLKSSGVICESFDDASLSRFMKLLQGVVRCDKRSDGDGDMILCKSDCAFILRFMFVTGISDGASFRRFAASFISSPLALVEKILGLISMFPLEGKSQDDILKTIWQASPRRCRDSNEETLTEQIKYCAEFFIPKDLAVRIDEDCSSLPKIWYQWATDLLHLFSEGKNVKNATEVVVSFREHGLLASQQLPYHNDASDLDSVSDAEDDSDAGDEDDSACLDVWFGQASYIVSEAFLATAAYSETLKLLRLTDFNVSVFKKYERKDLVSTFNKQLDVFGIPYGDSDKSDFPVNDRSDIHQSSDCMENKGNKESCVPLFLLPILCLDSGDVATILTGSNGYNCISRNSQQSNSSLDVRQGLPTALLESLLDISIVGIRGLHPHELLYRLYKLIDPDMDRDVRNNIGTQEFDSVLDQFRSILNSYSDCDIAGCVVSAELCRLRRVALHLSTFATACINHLRGRQFQFVDRRVLLSSIRQQHVFSGKYSFATIRKDEKFLETLKDNSALGVLPFSDRTNIQNYCTSLLRSLYVTLLCVRSGSVYNGTKIVATDKVLHDASDVPVLILTTNISSHPICKIIFVLVRYIWCAVAAQSDNEKFRAMRNIFSQAGWSMSAPDGSCRPDDVQEAEHGQENDMSELAGSENNRSSSKVITSDSTVATEGLHPMLRVYSEVLECETCSRDWSALHSAYCGVESVSMLQDHVERCLEMSLERRLQAFNAQRRRANQMVESCFFGNRMILWNACFASATMSSTPSVNSRPGEAVLDIAGAKGDWDIISKIMRTAHFVGALFYCTKFMNRHFKPLIVSVDDEPVDSKSICICGMSASNGDSSLMHFAMLDRRHDIIDLWSSFLVYAKEVFSQNYAHYYAVLAAVYRMLLSTRLVHFREPSFHGVEKNNFLFPQSCRLPDHKIRSRFSHSLLHDAIISGDEELAISLARLTAQVHTELLGHTQTEAAPRSIIYQDVGLYSYTVEEGMTELTSVLALWPFSVTAGGIEAIPRRVKNRYGFDAISSYAYGGKVLLLQKMIKEMNNNKGTDRTVLVNAFQLAVCGGHDKCAVILLRCMFTPDHPSCMVDDGVSEILRELNADGRLLRLLASSGQHRSLSLLMLHSDAYSALNLGSVIDDNDIRILFELSTMNGSARGGATIIKFCKTHKLTPPAVRMDNMPLTTFWELTTRILSPSRSYIRNVHKCFKTDRFNLYYYPRWHLTKEDAASDRKSGRKSSRKQGVTATSGMVEPKPDGGMSIANDGAEFDKENISTPALVKLKRNTTEPKTRPSVVIIRARGKVATFRTSSGVAAAADTT